MKQLTLSTTQEDIDAGHHTGYGCPFARALQRATGCYAMTAQKFAAVWPGVPVGVPEAGNLGLVYGWGLESAVKITWPEEITTAIRGYDRDNKMEPMTVTFEVPDEVPVA